MDWDNVIADETMLLSVHYTPGRSQRLSGIVLHHNAGNLSIQDCYNVWQNREASAHYQVDINGRIGQLVNDYDTAWHAGNANPWSIGIEHANNQFGPWTISDATLEAGAHLVAALCKYYGFGRPEWLVNVYPHSYFMATACPGEIAGSQNAQYMERAQYWYDQMTNPVVVTPLPDALKGFTDLDPDAWYIEPLEKMVKAGYLHGYPNGEMGPNNGVTRGELVTLIARIEGVESDDPYDDVIASPFYYNYVEWAKEKGIISSDNSTFRPNDVCLREEAMAMVARWSNGSSSVEHTEFTDWNQVDTYAKESVAWCIDKGIVSGHDSQLRPLDQCTRAEISQMLVNKLGL